MPAAVARHGGRTVSLLQVIGLVKSYGRRRVVDGVDFEVERGEIVGLLGPNGAGKTTTFNMTCGMAEPDAGRVLLGGQDVTDWPMYLRAREGGRRGRSAPETRTGPMHRFPAWA